MATSNLKHEYVDKNCVELSNDPKVSYYGTVYYLIKKKWSGKGKWKECKMIIRQGYIYLCKDLRKGKPFMNINLTGYQRLEKLANCLEGALEWQFILTPLPELLGSGKLDAHMFCAQKEDERKIWMVYLVDNIAIANNVQRKTLIKDQVARLQDGSITKCEIDYSDLQENVYSVDDIDDLDVPERPNTSAGSIDSPSGAESDTEPELPAKPRVFSRRRKSEDLGQPKILPKRSSSSSKPTIHQRVKSIPKSEGQPQINKSVPVPTPVPVPAKREPTSRKQPDSLVFVRKSQQPQPRPQPQSQSQPQPQLQPQPRTQPRLKPKPQPPIKHQEFDPYQDYNSGSDDDNIEEEEETSKSDNEYLAPVNEDAERQEQEQVGASKYSKPPDKNPRDSGFESNISNSSELPPYNTMLPNPDIDLPSKMNRPSSIDLLAERFKNEFGIKKQKAVPEEIVEDAQAASIPQVPRPRFPVGRPPAIPPTNSRPKLPREVKVPEALSENDSTSSKEDETDEEIDELDGTLEKTQDETQDDNDDPEVYYKKAYYYCYTDKDKEEPSKILRNKEPGVYIMRIDVNEEKHVLCVRMSKGGVKKFIIKVDQEGKCFIRENGPKFDGEIELLYHYHNNVLLEDICLLCPYKCI